jgi:hypothetical protein
LDAVATDFLRKGSGHTTTPHRNRKFGPRVPARLHSGVDPRLVDDAWWWRRDDLWHWSLEVLVAYVEAATDGTAEKGSQWRK